MSADLIDLSTVTILNSPDVHAWPITTSITEVYCTPDNTRFKFSKQDGADAWPDQPFGQPGDAGTIQYTVWLFLRIAGQWFAAGFIQCWRGRDGVGDAVSDYVKNWMLPGRGWEPMVGHAIVPGETIGFMVTAGNARLNGSTSVQERSNIVTIVAPDADQGRFDFSPAPTPTPTPAPTPTTDDLLDALIDTADAIVADLSTIVEAVDKLSNRLDAIRNQKVLVKS